ncbi:MAG: TetR/AcrR family transcriptional regulator [Solirubrobacteraceae bacterium]
MSLTSMTPQRKDAQRNHEAILAAARELFADSADVPMCEVARRAGVGQATLYRNFPDRRNLVSALLAEQMERTERIAAQRAGDPDAFFVIVRTIVENVASCFAVGQLAREDACLGSELARMRQRLAELIEEPIADAKAAGTLRRDVTIEDLFLLVSACRGAMDGAAGPVARAVASGRLLTLLFNGLSPPSDCRDPAQMPKMSARA